MTVPKKHTLLVVDDESDVADSVHDLLRREFRVLRAHNADEGLRLLRENEVHIIMTDQRMPKASGVELLEKARVRHPQAVRLLFTGYADIDSIIAAINQGHVFGFLRKPWQPHELEQAVREAAAEYDRLVQQADMLHTLREEVRGLHQRITALEAEVEKMRKG
jgi:DNA-binding NtrC family response regulator